MDSSIPTKLSEFMALDAVAATFGVSKSTVAGWRDLGLPTIKVGQKVYVHEASVARWLKSRERTITQG